MNVPRTAFIHCCLLAIAGVMLFFPRLITNVANPEDVGHHLIWVRTFAEAFWDGSLYPRWLMSINGGLGGPAPLYYPPLTLWVGSLLHPVATLVDPAGWMTVFTSATLAISLSAFTCYLWLRRHVTPEKAFIGALFYLLHPYHIGIDLYMRFALAELWAFVWLPLIALGIEKTAARESHGKMLLILSLAGVTLTHLPSAMLAYPVPLIYGIALSAPWQRFKNGWRILLCQLTGLALSAFYLLPAVMHLDWVHIHVMSQAELHYTWHFLFSNHTTAMFVARKEQLEVTCAFSVLLGGVAFFKLWRAHPEPEARKIYFFWFMALLACGFMTTVLSKSLWDVLPLLNRIQFPWRFNTIMIIAFIALWARLPLSRGERAIYGASFLLIGLLPVLLIVVSGNVRPYNAMATESGVRQLQYNFAPAFEHIPTDVSLYYLGSEDFQTRMNEPHGLAWTSGGGIATVKQWHHANIRLNIWSDQGGEVELNHFYFPLWHARTEEGKEQGLHAAPESGLMRLTLPPGSYEIRLALKPSTPQAAGAWISLAAFLGMIAWSLRAKPAK